MHDFIYKDIYTIDENDGDGRKTLRKNKIEPKKNHRLVTPNPVYNMEADCLPISERIENKLDLPSWRREVS